MIKALIAAFLIGVSAVTYIPGPINVDSPYTLTASERDAIEHVVMAEMGGESHYGQTMIAYCILNQLQSGTFGDSVYDVLNRPGNFATTSKEPTSSVIDAVKEVFDFGYTPVDAPVEFFYIPPAAGGWWHETQTYVCTVDGVRFFARR